MADKQYRVKFQCPIFECDSTVVEEVMVEVSQFSPITDIIPIGEQLYCAVDYGDYSHGGGRILHYACWSCEYVLRIEYNDMPISESTELFEWLKRHNMLEEV